MRHYKAFFKDKIVFCNCDDPFESEFFKYFALNFNHLELKKLICTSYAGSPISYTELNDLPLFHRDEKMPYMIEITQVNDLNEDGAEDMMDIELLLRNNENVLTILDGDGDFRSEECIDFLQEADIIVTNPPFSLFREYVNQLMEFNKSFIILGPMNALHYKEIFPLIKENKMWTGYGFNKTFSFRMPDYYESSTLVNGQKIGKVPGICWYTNVDIDKRHEGIILYRQYSPESYIRYENLDAIDVGKVSEIPDDYYGLIGVPDSFLEHYNPEQFELVGLGAGDLAKEIGVTKNYRGRTDIYYIKDGKPSCPYSRIIIRRRKNEN